MTTTPHHAPLDRNLAIEMVRVTEAAAKAAGRVLGWDDKDLADQMAVDAMRAALDSVVVDGEVVIGEGEKDEAPMLYIGERVGSGAAPVVDIAVDPIEGTTLVANGMPGAVSIITLAERGTMMPSHVAYMEKIVVGPAARGAIDITAPASENLRNIAHAMGVRPGRPHGGDAGPTTPPGPSGRDSFHRSAAAFDLARRCVGRHHGGAGGFRGRSGADGDRRRHRRGGGRLRRPLSGWGYAGTLLAAR